MNLLFKSNSYLNKYCCIPQECYIIKPIIKSWPGMEGIQFVQTLTEEEICQTAKG